jgi:hypothetical protein
MSFHDYTFGLCIPPLVAEIDCQEHSEMVGADIFWSGRTFCQYNQAGPV